MVISSFIFDELAVESQC